MRKALDQPAVPLNFWGELLKPGSYNPTLAPETLLAWLSRSTRGCRFSPAVDVWHVGVYLASSLLQCEGHTMAPQTLRGRPNSSATSFVHTLANHYGTDALSRLLAKHGWTIEHDCKQVCRQPPGPLSFAPAVVDTCIRRCMQRTSADPALASGAYHLPARRFHAWCRMPPPSWSRPDRWLRDAATSLVVKMLELDPDARITAAEALEHPFIKGTKK